MRLSRFLVPLLAFSWIEACSVYHDGLLGDSDDNADSSGGKSSGGKPNTSSGGKGGDDDDGDSGGRASGGASTGGNTNPSSGGATDNVGGTSSGGATPESGGASPSGGSEAVGGSPSGGAPAMGPFLVTDMSKGTFSNSPFFGKIDRYQQNGTTWAGSNVTGMLTPREDDEDDLALHVAATFADDDWGIDIAITLKSGQPFDLSPYKNLSFELKGVPTAEVRIGLEDYASHRDTDLCTLAGEGDDCDKHVESLATFEPGSKWETIEIDFSSFEGCGLGCERTNDLDMTRVYAIHFKMDPPEGEDVDFFLDNIYIDN